MLLVPETVRKLSCLAKLPSSLHNVGGGVIRGVAKMKFGAVFNLIVRYCIGLPIGLPFMFTTTMGVVGLWTGLTISVGLQAIFFSAFLYKLDWRKAAEETPNTNQAPLPALTPRRESTAEDHRFLQIPEQQDTATNKVKDVPTVKEMLLRHGLVLLALVVTFAAGIILTKKSMLK
ncbi:multidrug and toxin extrusion protein 1-like [Phycodurus eques]|uniref:multidrug and toxin extrusion protein 1-like n=1 Tax=Phycodurus eques TaxID=693459 RepID=UPI002ACEAC78|nr:multidrug and toxin extrusion protein 1-like [Phycodurus eques]